MTIELINTGTELLLGRVLNTHQQWVCDQLAGLGYLVARQTAVPDSAKAIQEAVRESLARADCVITTGGLGPTSDDITCEAIADLLGKKLGEDPATLAQIESFFTQRKRPTPATVRGQALVPEGAIVFPNPNGTAPGLAMEIAPNRFRADGKTSWLILLPGPPRELRPMFTESVVPLLGRELPVTTPFAGRTLRTTGLGESILEERIAVPLQKLVTAGLEVGYCARPGQVDVRLSARGPNATALVREGENMVNARLGEHIFGAGEDEIGAVVLRLLAERKQTLAFAESCTGGCIAHWITNVPGASAVFVGGIVAYSNDAKVRFLGVRAETLARHGAVSEAVAREMAEGARQQTAANYALAVTGIAGPSGGTADKPVGTVFIALAGPFPTLANHHLNPFDRETFKDATARQALDLLRRSLLAGRAA